MLFIKQSNPLRSQFIIVSDKIVNGSSRVFRVFASRPNGTAYYIDNRFGGSASRACFAPAIFLRCAIVLIHGNGAKREREREKRRRAARPGRNARFSPRVRLTRQRRRALYVSAVAS